VINKQPTLNPFDEVPMDFLIEH